jgi:hypothetical protein
MINRYRVTLLFLSFLSICLNLVTSFAQDKKLNIEGQLGLEVGSPSGAKVTIEKSGRSAGSVQVAANGQFEIDLDFDSDYTLIISQPGFIPVKIRMITNASADAKRDGLMPYSLPIFLTQTYPGGPDGSKVSATVKFDEMLYDFTVDKQEFKTLTAQKKEALAQKEKIVAANNANAEAELKAKQEAIAKRYAEEEAARKLANAEEERLRKEKELNDKYNEAIGKADKAFAQSEWEYAKQFFQEAATLKPAEAYPKTKLTEIENRLANEKKYASAIERGDKALIAKDYALAKAAFNEALLAKSNDAYAKGKLKEADDAIAEAARLKELDAKYTAQIAAADKLFLAKKWSDAKASYTEASKLKPDEKYPKDRIAESEKLFAEEEAKKAAEKELNDKYVSAVARGDKLFIEKRWSEAKEAFSEASGLKPLELAPKNKIKEIEAIEKAEADKAAKEKETNEKYAAAVAKGDAAFSAGNLTEAKTGFTEASVLKPEEVYPKNKIKEIDALVAAETKRKEEEKALGDKYNAAISKGDKALLSKLYAEAKTAYTEAANLKPQENYPKQKLEEVAKLLADEEAAKAAELALNEQYNQKIKKADSELGAKNYEQAKTLYNEALTLKPKEVYPAGKIKEIEAAQKAEADRLAKEADVQAKYQENVAKGDAAFTQSDWAAAKTAYTEAGNLKPSENYPKDKLVEVEQRLKAESDRQAAQAALEKKYTDAMALGEKQLLAKKYPEAKAAFSDASALKPEDNLPKQKIAQIDQLIAELDAAAKKKAEEEAKLAAEEAARKKAEEEAKKAADEAARKKAQEEADALARKKAEEEAAAKKLAEEEAAKKAAEAETKRKAEEEAARIAAEEAAKKKAQELEAAKKLAEEEASKKAAEAEAKRKAQEEADALARKKAEEEAAARKLAEEEAAKKMAQELEAAQKLAEEEAAKKAAEAEAKRKAQEEATRLAEAELNAKKAAEAEAARKKAEEEAVRLAMEEQARQKALAEKEAEDKRRAQEEAEKLAAEEEEKQRRIMEEMAKKQSEAAARQKAYEQEQARQMAERKRQLEEALRLKEEEEKLRKKVLADAAIKRDEGPFVVIYKYSFSTDQVYGYINMGDNTGIREISLSDYNMLMEKYRPYIRNIFNWE